MELDWGLLEIHIYICLLFFAFLSLFFPLSFNPVSLDGWKWRALGKVKAGK